jgi:hypothetical protein
MRELGDFQRAQMKNVDPRLAERFHSVTLPAAGYHYNSNWTPLLAGLSPAGMAASFAAPDPVVQDYRNGFLRYDSPRWPKVS